MPYDPGLVGNCPPPFYQTNVTGVYYDQARICLPTTDCCLPCPITQFIFDDRMALVNNLVAIFNTVSLGLAVFVLASFGALPSYFTHSSFDKSSIVTAVVLVNIGFMVPWIAGSTHTASEVSVVCADPVTPNDMHSSPVCAVSGFSSVFGALALMTWALITSVLLHLKLCWGREPGDVFFTLIQMAGWVFPVAITAAAISITGVSFRLGPGACHINHPHALATFWSWLLAAISAAAVVQLSTWAFLAFLYVKNYWRIYRPSADSDHSASSVSLLQELRKTIRSQWRLLFIVTGLFVVVVFFVIVFYRLDRGSDTNNPQGIPWVMCLLEHPHDPTGCFHLAQEIVGNQTILSAALLMLSLFGIPVCLLVIRRSFFIGWARMLRNGFGIPSWKTWRKQRSDRRHKSEDEEMELHGESDGVPLDPARSANSSHMLSSVEDWGGTKGTSF
ncbi:hypothetical protein ANO11243_027470 [Dothideomycetidae sp. 11243]|nr:hypothetical protein ANO11243_027470 [fungal sp. No.11243]